MARASHCTLALVIGIGITPAQTADREPAFEVAYVKRSDSGTQDSRFGLLPGGSVVVTNYTLRNITRQAWNLEDSHIVGSRLAE